MFRMPAKGFKDYGKKFKTAAKIKQKSYYENRVIQTREVDDWHEGDRKVNKEDGQQGTDEEEKQEECDDNTEEEIERCVEKGERSQNRVSERQRDAKEDAKSEKGKDETIVEEVFQYKERNQ